MVSWYRSVKSAFAPGTFLDEVFILLLLTSHTWKASVSTRHPIHGHFSMLAEHREFPRICRRTHSHCTLTGQFQSHNTVHAARIYFQKQNLKTGSQHHRPPGNESADR